MKMPVKIRLLLVDDHFIVRVGLAGSLQLESDMEIVADCGSGEEALGLFDRHRPDLVLMDGRLPGLSGDETTARLIQKHPDARVLMLSVRDGEEDVHRAVRAGVKGYLNKAARREEIIAAIRAVHAGGAYFNDSIKAKLARRSRRPDLTSREREILRLIVNGLSNKEIASRLNVAEVTVKLHVGHILEKLEVADRTQAVTAAIQRGLIFID
jgi:DNA-binding NarL/FixJ family response regulator